MAINRCSILCCVLLFALIAPKAWGKQPSPSAQPPQVELNVVIAELNLQKGDHEQILTTLVDSLNGSQQCLLEERGCVVWTVKDGKTYFPVLQRPRERHYGKFLACPKMVTVSGHTATVLSGGRLAISEPSATDHESSSVRYEDFGIKSSIRPVVIDKS